MTSNLQHKQLFLGGLHLLMIAILFSKALVSICLWFVVLLSIVRFISLRPFAIALNKMSFDVQYYRTKDRRLYFLMGFFLLTLISVFWSENFPGWRQILLLKTPFILLPFTFIHHPKLTNKQIEFLYLTFITTITICSAVVLFRYVLSSDIFHQKIGTGGAILTPLTHVKFSVLTAFSAICAGYLAGRKSDIQRYSLIAVCCFLVFVVHILAVRSGLLILYSIGGFLFLLQAYRMKGVSTLIGATLLVLLLPIFAYVALPSVKYKVHYMLYDLKMIKEGKEANFSDGERLRSLSIGVQIWKENILYGTGAGDLRDECNKKYNSQFPESKKKILPHNQFVLVGASYGVIGFIFFLYCLLGLTIHHFEKENVLFNVMIACIILYGMVEKPLDEYVFVTVFSLFCCIEINRQKIKNTQYAD